MDTENGSERISSNNSDEVHSHKQTHSDLATLAELAAKATARFAVNTDVSIDPRHTTFIAQTATVRYNSSTTTTTTTAKPTTNAVIASEITDKPLSQKSDDSDCTIQSDQSERNALKRLAALTNDKTYTDDRTLNRILHAHSEQRITTAHVELDCNSNATVALELVQHGGAGSDGASLVCLKGSLTEVRDAPKRTAAEQAADVEAGGSAGGEEVAQPYTPTGSVRSIGSLVCRICHNSENPERLVSPCLCKGSLTYVHIHCLERWISTSRSTVCELCQFQYNTVQTLRYTCIQSLRMWYSRSMSRRALQEDCQMFSLLTLVAFGIIGTLLVGIQYYVLQGQTWGLSRMWTKGWLVFFLFTTLTIYFINIYMILKSQLGPWYRWWQSARDIKLILENRKPFQLRSNRCLESHQLAQELSNTVEQQQQQQDINAPSSVQMPQANSTPAATSTPYEPNHQIQPTSAAISIPIHIQNIPIRIPIPICATNTHTTSHLPITINTIELQCNEHNNNNNKNNFIDNTTTNTTMADDDVLSCCGKRPPLVMATLKSAAVALQCNKLTTAAAIEIPLESCLYEFETVM